jgi:aminomethyltransferase
VHYRGIREEHLAVRRDVGVFDVSHMGQIESRGPGAVAFLQRLLSNDVGALPVGGVQYGLLCREDGGVLDDLLSYRLGEDRLLIVTNAVNHERDLAWLRRHAEAFDVEVHDRQADYAMLAVQGPHARELLAPLASGRLPGHRRCVELELAGAPALVCGSGYTGEDGAEILLAPDSAASVWDRLVQRGAAPAGLAARDTLRLEVCLPLYGNELSEERGPIEAGLGWCCREDTGFIGSDAVRAVRDAGPAEELAPFVLTGPGIPRRGHRVVGGGVVTSGTLSPCLGRGIGLAYLSAERAVPGAALEIDVRGTHRAARVVRKPIYPARIE